MLTMRHHLSLATILLLSTALPALSAPKWQEYGVTTEGKSMSLDASSPRRERGENTVHFKYRVTDLDGNEKIRTAMSEDCFAGKNSRVLDGKPSSWSVKVEDSWMTVMANSDASTNMLINACRIANDSTMIPRQTNEVKCKKSTGASAETKNYYVNICGDSTKENPLTFVLTEKKGKTIMLPVNKNQLFIATNGSFEYILKVNSPKEPNPCECGGEIVNLTIKKAGKVIISDRVIHDRGGYFFLP
jgi:hypothetical protein